MPGCEETSPYALQVLGDSMEPEFQHGTIIILDPAYPATDGSYVVVEYQGDTSLRMLVVEGDRRYLKPLNEAYPTVELAGPFTVRGVVVQQNRRRKIKHYV